MILFGRSRRDQSGHLLNLSPHDKIGMRDLARHTMMIAATGSGKTLSGIYTLTKAALRGGCAVVATCAKSEDGSFYESILRECGAPFIRLRPGGGHQIDGLDYLSSHYPPGEVGGFFDSVMELINRAGGYGGNSGEAFWPSQASLLLKRGVVALSAAGEVVSFQNLQRLLSETPVTPDGLLDQKWQQTSWSAGVFRKADKGTPETDAACNGYLVERPRLGEKTRGGIEAYCHLLFDRFLSDPCRRIFASGTSTFAPEHVTQAGVSVIIDVPALQYGAPGVFGQVMFLSILARAALKRQNPHPPIVFIVDEFPIFATQEVVRWGALGRSKGLWLLAAMQSISGLQSMLGGDEKARVAAEGILANFQTVFYGQNNDHATCMHMAEKVGKERKIYRSFNIGSRSLELFGDAQGFSMNSGGSEQEAYGLDPARLSRLSPGEFVAVQSGRVWNATGKTFLLTRFPFKG